MSVVGSALAAVVCALVVVVFALDAAHDRPAPRIWVPAPAFNPAIVIEGMIEDASRCGVAEYADLDRVMTLRLAPELEEPWVAIYQGRRTYHPTVREAGLSLLRRALAHTPPARKATQRSVT